jgi:Mlc titration factor MtfA (ptsG expression regulator)
MLVRMQQTEAVAAQSNGQGASSSWERSTQRSAILFAVVGLVASTILALSLTSAGIPLVASLVAAVVVAGVIYRVMTRRLRLRRRILATPFPEEWERILDADVAFFGALDAEEKVRFRRDLQLFMGEKRITGIKLALDTQTEVLVAASAIIPIFGFLDWEWDQINEVLVYPDRFNADFAFEGTAERHTLGMVGTGVLNRVMILSTPDLVAGFRNSRDRRNVGFHEFSHLVDKSDGVIDGVPRVGLPQDAVGPWLDLVRRKMTEIRQGNSDIDPYGLTSEAEFFAVAAEYFFERPGMMERKHPELYSMLSRIFNQNMSERAVALAGRVRRRQKSFGRNSPCPCGSGAKFKKCCLGKARK